MKKNKKENRIEKTNSLEQPMYEPCAELLSRVKGRETIVTRSRHEGIGSDRPFKLLVKSLCLLSYSHKKREERPEHLSLFSLSHFRKFLYKNVICFQIPATAT